jgi:uncharacterized tellurite resistance protein B-like protein
MGRAVVHPPRGATTEQGEKTMHIVIGVVTALAGLIWALVALQRAGVRIGSLDPFAWYRRMQWRKKYADKPLYCLTDPVDVAAVLLLATAKCEGEVSAEQKQALLKTFESEFSLSADEAADLLVACAHLLRNEVYVFDNLERVLERAKDRFSVTQVASLATLMRRVAELDGPANGEQRKLIDATQRYFEERAQPKSAWG